MLAAPFRLQKNQSTVSPPFLRDSHCSFFQYSSHASISKAVIASCKPSSPILNFFDFLLKNHALGIPNTAANFQNGVNGGPYMLPRSDTQQTCIYIMGPYRQNLGIYPIWLPWALHVYRLFCPCKTHIGPILVKFDNYKNKF